MDFVFSFMSIAQAIIDGSSPEPYSGCWIWHGPWCKGYGRLCIEGKSMVASRASYEAFKGNAMGNVVCHKCDTPACVNPDHLFMATQKDNIRDCMAKGRKRGYTILTDDQVRWIRENYEPKSKTMNFYTMGKMLGVSPSTISVAWRGKSWSKIK